VRSGIGCILVDPVGCLADFSTDEPRAYEDVVPALAALKDLGITVIAASSMSSDALTRFVQASGLNGFFDHVCGSASAGDATSDVLRRALGKTGIAPDRTLFITDNADGLVAARAAGVHGILMMNDPDEAMKLTAHKPAGGIVSLLELPDFVRFVSSAHLGG
jgi:phosphoglycolate phosphatase-like HAD superfamily hydrolase